MSDREKETIHQVVLPDFGPSSSTRRPTPNNSDPASLVDQVSDRVTVGTGARDGGLSAQKRPTQAKDIARPKHDLNETDPLEPPESPLNTLNFPTVAELEKYLSPVDKRPAKPHTLRLLLAAVIGGIIIIALYMAIKQTSQPPRQAVAKSQKSQKAVPDLAPEPIGKPLQLPSFVTSASLDAAYTRSNPGWERYVTNATEFRVFREGSAIRALQAIDLTGKGIPEDFAKKALAEVADLTEAVPRTTERKGVYIIERSQPSPVTRAVLYRKDPSRQIRAFVVYFD